MPPMRHLLRGRPRKILTAPNERIYAIGDIHGRYDLLQRLMKLIIEHWSSADTKPRRVRLLFLGDVIDRGPDSKGCLRLVSKLALVDGVVCLKGNHEDLMLRSIHGDPEAQRIWLANGGTATLDSFDVSPPQSDEDAIDFAERLRERIDQDFVEMLERAPSSVASGNYLFVHAGVKPGVALAKQVDFNLFFIRDDFTKSTDWHGAMVVHGHTIVDEVAFHDNRIAVDTGAYYSGKLSCLVLEDDQRSVIIT